MNYLLVKHLHQTLALITVIGFMLRSYWMVCEPQLLQNRWVKTLPHLIDSALLVSAILLVKMSGFYPFVYDWVTIKVIFLFAYVILGSIALKHGKTKNIRLAALIAAFACICIIFASALKKPMLL